MIRGLGFDVTPATQAWWRTCHAQLTPDEGHTSTDDAADVASASRPRPQHTTDTTPLRHRLKRQGSATTPATRHLRHRKGRQKHRHEHGYSSIATHAHEQQSENTRPTQTPTKHTRTHTRWSDHHPTSHSCSHSHRRGTRKGRTPAEGCLNRTGVLGATSATTPRTQAHHMDTIHTNPLAHMDTTPHCQVPTDEEHHRFACETGFATIGLPPDERYTWARHIFGQLQRCALDYVFIDARSSARTRRTHIRSVPGFTSDHRAVGHTLLLDTSERNTAGCYTRTARSP